MRQPDDRHDAGGPHGPHQFPAGGYTNTGGLQVADIQVNAYSPDCAERPEMTTAFSGTVVAYPSMVDFGYTATTGPAAQRTVKLVNKGTDTAFGCVYFPEPFSLVSGSTTYSLEPGDTATLTVGFLPTEADKSYDLNAATVGADPVAHPPYRDISCRNRW